MSNKFSLIIVLAILALVLNVLIWGSCFFTYTLVITYNPKFNYVDVSYNFEEPKDVTYFHNEIAPLIAPKEELCRNVSFLVTVHVRANDTRNREEWREMYDPLKVKYNFHMVFVLGHPGTDEEEDSILEEAREYGDILQGDFLDTYHNISYKQLTHLNYVDKNCNTPLIVKLDDDIFNVPKFVDMMKNGGMPKSTSKGSLKGNKIWCLVWKKAPVRHSGKWNVDKKGKFYPDYCAGMAYFTTKEAVTYLVKAAPSVDFFWVDDILITGYIAKQAKTALQNVPEFFTRNTKDFKKFVSDKRMFSLTERNNTSTWFNKLHLQ